MLKKYRELKERDKAKRVINDGVLNYCPACKMALHNRMKEEIFCPYCGQRTIKN